MEIQWTVLLLMLGSSCIELCVGETYCAYSKQSIVKVSKFEVAPGEEEESSFMAGELLDSNSTELCPKGFDYCYALWQEDTQTKQNGAGHSLSIIAQGCWDSSGEVDCSVDECVSKKRPPKALNNTKFCCCLGNMCNSNVTDAYVPSDEDIHVAQPALQFVEQASYQTEVVVIVLAAICSSAVVVTAGIFIFRQFISDRKPGLDSMHMLESASPPLQKFDLDNLKLQEIVGRGRFGSVSKGTLNDHQVAIKVFIMQHRQYFLNERDIYSLPHMDHPCLPKYIGADEKLSTDGRTEYLLVLSYAPLGCMQDFLRHNTVDWPTLCKMAQTVTQGLAHLHTEFKKGDKLKPCVAHRDLNTRNILVKHDGSCELCDFGFAIRISGSKYYQNGEEQVAETTSLADVGTLRYMAPEVLEGAVNLRDCESSLKQIDIYALGLVLWEIGTRCTDLYQGVEVPDYQLPFEMEIGLHPSMEQMQVLVTRNKARPLFPDIWKASNPAVRLFKETIEDCWDQDAEARLTALCVEERLMELPVLWERYKTGNTVSGVSPTVNLTSSQQRSSQLGNLVSGNLQQIQSLMTFDSSDKNAHDYRSDTDQNSSVSENTADTLLTMSPSGETATTPANFHFKNNANNYCVAVPFLPKFSVPLQPHQGRNPCMERNLMEPDQEVSVWGNRLLEKSGATKNLDFPFLLNDEAYEGLHFPESIESNVLVSNDVLNQTSRACNPIPYVQNAVHDPAGAMPKQPNLPGNGRHPPAQEVKNDKKKPFCFFDKKKSNKDRGFKLGLKNLLERRKTSKNQVVVAEDQHLLQNSPLSDKPNSPLQEATLYCESENGQKSNVYGQDWYQKLSPVVTKVYMVGSDRNNSTREMIVKPMVNGHLPNYGCEDFYRKNEGPLVHRDINDNCGLLGSKFSRPDSLAVQGHSSMQQAEPSASSSGVQSNSLPRNDREKIVRRIKTPFELKKGRFSLCDDRVMSEEDVLHSSEVDLSLTNSRTWSPKISLSLPMDINAICASDSDSRSDNCGPTQI